MAAKLTPPDLTRCQAERREGAWPTMQEFMVLGPPRWVRCSNVPTVVSTERTPGPDGQRGSMSLCDGCLKKMIEQVGPDYAEICPIES